MEIWEKLKNYEDSHQVSNLGKVRTVERTVKGLNGLRKYKSKLLTIFIRKKDSYCRICLCKNGEERIEYLHRIVAETFIENPENKPQVNHKNGIKSDNRVENLEWCTPKENTHHGFLTGLTTRYGGENSTNWYIPKEIVKELYKLAHYSGRTLSSISEEYGTPISTISDIKHKRIRKVDTEGL